MTQSVYWYDIVETDMGDSTVEWRFDFAPGEYLGLYRNDEELIPTEYPEAWGIGVELSEAQRSCHDEDVGKP